MDRCSSMCLAGGQGMEGEGGREGESLLVADFVASVVVSLC